MEKFAENFFKQLTWNMENAAAWRSPGKALPFIQAITLAHKIIIDSAKRGGKVMLIGNGGSASIASHIAVDLWKNARVKALAFNDSSLLTCISNDLGFEQVFKAPTAMFAEKGDVLIAISSSGKSKNILNGAAAAKKAGCAIITLSGFRQDNPLGKTGKINFFVPSKEYAFVETVHSAICHSFVDCLINARR